MFQHYLYFQELDYWGLTELDIEPCCWGHYSKFKDHRETLAALDDNFTQQTNVEVWGEKVSYLQRFRHQVWNFIEEPSTSRGAKVSFHKQIRFSGETFLLLCSHLTTNFGPTQKISGPILRDFLASTIIFIYSFICLNICHICFCKFT